MSSLGVPERRIIGAVLALTVPIVIALLLMAEFVIPPAQELAQARRASALSPSMSFHAENTLWAQRDLEYLNVQQFGRGDVPIGIDIYTFADDGSLESLIHADRAKIRTDGTWLLTAVTRKRVRDLQFTTDHLATLPWHSFLAPQQVRFLFLPIQSIPPIALYSYIRTVEARNQKVPQYEAVFWDKVSIPLSLIAMVMLAAPFAFGPPRAHSTGRNLSFGIGFGIVYSLAQQVLSQIGLLLDLSPAISALAPPLLVMVAAVASFRDLYRPEEALVSVTAPLATP
jgi:lipopolysaccharide export system permease protein